MNVSYAVTKGVPSADELQFLDDRIYEYNSAKTGQDDGHEFGFFVRNDEQEIVAGISGWTWAKACQILNLWVHSSLRGQGYGQMLLESAEEEARGHGCTVVTLNSYSFQSPAFYEKYGYELVHQLLDFPPGHQDNLLMKRLA